MNRRSCGWTLVGLGLALLVSGGCGPTPGRDFVTQAEQAYNVGEYQRALELLDLAEADMSNAPVFKKRLTMYMEETPYVRGATP